MGTIVPDMGMTSPDSDSDSNGDSNSPRDRDGNRNAGHASLSDALFTATQRRVLARLFDGRDEAYSVSELIRLTHAGSGAVQRELAKLAGSGMLTVEQVGNQKRYRANGASPIHDELVGIVSKTFGLAVPLRQALQPVADRIDLAFVFGPVAKGTDTASSEVDLMIVSDTIGYSEALVILEPVMERLGREIHPVIYSLAALSKRLASGCAFATSVLSQPRIWLHGSQTGLAALLSTRPASHPSRSL